jgi:hypothetical protein
VGDEQHRLPGLVPDAQQLGLHQIAGLGVERGERLVHQQHLGIGRQRARQPDALFHAARQLMRIMPLETLEPDHFDEFLAHRLALGGGDAAQLEPERDIVLDRAPRQQAELLEHHGAVLAGAGDLLAVDRHLAGIGRDQAEQHVEEGALAAARRADDGDELAFLDLDVEAVERVDRRPVLRREGQIDVGRADITRHLLPAPLSTHSVIYRPTLGRIRWSERGNLRR